jgi:hypothetical protein
MSSLGRRPVFVGTSKCVKSILLMFVSRDTHCRVRRAGGSFHTNVCVINRLEGRKLTALKDVLTLRWGEVTIVAFLEGILEGCLKRHEDAVSREIFEDHIRIAIFY